MKVLLDIAIIFVEDPKDSRTDVDMQALALLGDFLFGVSVVLMGIAACYYVFVSREE
jgi:hypothetical protein